MFGVFKLGQFQNLPHIEGAHKIIWGPHSGFRAPPLSYCGKIRDCGTRKRGGVFLHNYALSWPIHEWGEEEEEEEEEGEGGRGGGFWGYFGSSSILRLFPILDSQENFLREILGKWGKERGGGGKKKRWRKITKYIYSRLCCFVFAGRRFKRL